MVSRPLFIHIQELKERVLVAAIHRASNGSLEIAREDARSVLHDTSSLVEAFDMLQIIASQRSASKISDSSKSLTVTSPSDMPSGLIQERPRSWSAQDGGVVVRMWRRLVRFVWNR